MRSDRLISRGIAGWTAAAVMAALLGCDAPTVDGEPAGYDPRLGGTDIYHWPLGHRLAVFVDPASGGESLRDPVRKGFGAWRDSLRYSEVELALVDDPGRADVIVHLSAAPRLVDYGTCGSGGVGAAGVTFFCVATAGDSMETLALVSGDSGHVKMNVTIDPSRLSGSTTLPALVAHEIGHVLGIGTHASQSTDLMFTAPGVEVPGARDAAALRWLLHQPVTIRP